jgi:ATP-binding cassette subfamily F protein 3
LEALNINNTVLDEMKNCGSQQTEQELRNLLGCFLFSGDDVEKKIRVLSGGEKARVALAKTIVSKANFLMLDEPTNHLDMHSCDLLIDALNKYQGSLILVSHDRYFISKTANKIWEIVDHEIKSFDGGYEEYVEWKERMAKAGKSKEPGVGSRESGGRNSESRIQSPGEKPQTTNNKPQTTNLPAGQLENKPQTTAPINKEAKKELQKQQRLFQQLEEQIASLQKKKIELESDLSLPEIYSDRQKFAKAEADYKKAADELVTLNKEYERIFEKIMELENQ